MHYYLFRIEIKLGRQLFSFFVISCLPTLIMNFIAHLTNFYSDEHFDVSITVNLTVLLVLTNMYVHIYNLIGINVYC